MLFRLILLSLLGISVSGLLSCASTDSSKRQPASEEVGSLDEDGYEIPPVPKYQAQEQSFESPPVAPVPETTKHLKAKPYFEWPVDEAKLSRGFFTELRKVRGSRKKRAHFGIDLAARKGTNIYAAHDGTVIYSGRAFKGYGRMIMVEGKKGWATLYAHLSKSHVYEGQKVYQGQKIGDMGNTGRSTGPHLHFEIRTLKGPVNPLAYLPNGATVARLAENGRKPQGNLAHMGKHQEDPENTIDSEEDAVY